MKKASDEKLGNSCDATPEETAAMIENRNKAWMEKMPAIMADKPTFIAVGALHLVGENGLLQLLKNAGYTVEGLKRFFKGKKVNELKGKKRLTPIKG